MLSGLRLSFRIARREALRYKGRSALSIALLGIPLLGVSLGASAWDTMELSPVEKAEQKLGETDAYLRFDWEGVPVVQRTWEDEWGWTSLAEGTEASVTETVPVSEDQILAALPPGSTIAPYSTTGLDDAISVETPDGVGGIETAGYDLSNPIYEAAGLEYLEGEAPEDGEIVLSQAAADYTGAGVGDAVKLADGTAEYTVSGIVELAWDLDTLFAIGDSFSTASHGWLVDTPEEFTYDDALALNELGMYVWSTPLVADPPTAPPDDWDGGDNGYTAMVVGLIATVVIVEVILLAGPAFAISTRRRAREFAIMSAAGAAPRHLRNTVLAGGLLFGLIAAAIAVVVGLLAVWAAMPLMENVVGHRSAGLRMWPVMQATMIGFAIATGLLSALAAAVSASRVNVVAALAGRTLKRRLKKRWPIIGLVVIGLGTAAGFAGVVLWSMPLMAAAIVAMQLGLVMCTPLLVALVAKLGRWLPLAPRMALREAGRNRGSTAPAIAAVMSVVAAGIAISLTVTADNARWREFKPHTLPQGALSVNLSGEGESDGAVEPDFDAGAEQVERILSEHLDDPQLHRIFDYTVPAGCDPYVAEREAEAELPPEGCMTFYRVERPEDNRCPYLEADTDTEAAREAALEEARNDPRCDETTATAGFSSNSPGSDDPAVVAAYTELEGDELAEAVAFLEEGGMLTSDRWQVNENGNVEVTLSYYDSEAVDGEREEVVEVPAMTVDKGLLGYNETFIGPAAAERLGLADSTWGAQYLVETSTEVTDTVQQQLAAEFERASIGDFSVHFSVTDYTDDRMFYFTLAVALLCGIVALGATAVSTGLIIAESKADMTTLGAVGAEPKVRKRFAMWQTLVIAWLGAGLGTAAGLLGYVLIREALNRSLRDHYPFQALYGWELPWANFGISLLAVPLIAAVGALLFTKAKLPSERRLT